MLFEDVAVDRGKDEVVVVVVDDVDLLMFEPFDTIEDFLPVFSIVNLFNVGDLEVPIPATTCLLNIPNEDTLQYRTTEFKAPLLVLFGYWVVSDVSAEWYQWSGVVDAKFVFVCRGPCRQNIHYIS